MIISLIAICVLSIGVLVGIFALVYQVRMNTKYLKLQNFTEYTRRYQEIILNLPENINSNEFEFKYMSEDRREITLRYLRAYYDLCSEEHYLWKEKLISEDVWGMWSIGMGLAFKKKAFREAWDIIQSDSYFSKEFAEFVKTTRESLEEESGTFFRYAK